MSRRIFRITPSFFSFVQTSCVTSIKAAPPVYIFFIKHPLSAPIARNCAKVGMTWNHHSCSGCANMLPRIMPALKIVLFYYFSFGKKRWPNYYNSSQISVGPHATLSAWCWPDALLVSSEESTLIKSILASSMSTFMGHREGNFSSLLATRSKDES